MPSLHCYFYLHRININTHFFYKKLEDTTCEANIDDDSYSPDVSTMNELSTNKVGENHAMHPVSVTLAVFNQETRRRPKDWKCIGYIKHVKGMDIKSGTSSQIEISREKLSLKAKAICSHIASALCCQSDRTEPRTKYCQKIFMFHHPFHINMDIIRFCVSRNIHSKIGENHHKVNGKALARRTSQQKQNVVVF